MERLHTYITQLSQTFYDPDKEKVMVNYPNNSEGRQLEQVYHEVFKHLLTVKKELDYYSLPIIDTGILKYDGEKERFIFKSVREDLPLSAGMDLEILVEDYFTEENTGFEQDWIICRKQPEEHRQAVGTSLKTKIWN